MMRASALLCVALLACQPTAPPLAGAPEPSVVLPRIELPAGHRRIVFRWDYEENAVVRGEGAARVAAPDSARVDLYLQGGLPAGWAVLIGDSLRGPNADVVRRFLPPPPMMWAALGRLVIPPLADTVVRTSNDTIYAEVGNPAVWRVKVYGQRVYQLVRLSSGRIAEVVTRDATGRLLYEVPGRRKLYLGIVREETVPAFDPVIWGR